MLKPYSNKSDISYTIGVFPTIELLNSKPKQLIKVLLNPKGDKNNGISKITEICEQNNIPLETNKALIEKLSKSENTYAVGVFSKYQSKLEKNKNHLVLVNPSDMGNLGTICRTMLAFDFYDLAIINPAVDIFDPKVIRASMGAVFKLNFEYFTAFEDYKSAHQNKIYAFMGDGEKSITEVKYHEPFSLIFGNEGAGLDDDYRDIGTSVKIPQSDQIDSFNLSIAVAIGLYSTTLKKNYTPK